MNFFSSWTIISIEDYKLFVRFKIEVDVKLSSEDVVYEKRLGLIEGKEHSSVIQLNFFRHKPYYTNN